MVEKMTTTIALTNQVLRMALLAASLLALDGCAATGDASLPEPEQPQASSPNVDAESLSSDSNEGDKALRRDWCCALKMEGIDEEIVIGCLNYSKRLRVVAEAQCWSAGTEDQGLSSTTLRSGHCDRYPDCFNN